MKERHEFKLGETAYIYRVSEPLESVMDMKCIVTQVGSGPERGMYRVRTQNNVDILSWPEEIYDNPISVIDRIRSRVKRDIRDQEEFLKKLDDVEKKAREEQSAYYQPDMFDTEN